MPRDARNYLFDIEEAVSFFSGKRPFDVSGMVGDPGKAICKGCVEEFYRAFQEPNGEGEST
jgi:hypothetical protein